MNKLKVFFISLLPGLFLIGLNIGTGSVTAMAKAGANYGMALLWTVMVSCYITYFLINIYGKFTLVTGETALAAFRKHIHPAVGLFFIVALTLNVCGSVMGVMGIIADICYEWSASFMDQGIPPIWFAAFFAGIVYLFFLTGKTKSFEKILAAIVGIMALCFIVNFFILMPSWQSILRGLVPKMPDDAGNSDASPFLVIASMVGTTVFSGLFIVRTILVRESGWTLKDIKIQRRDAIISAAMMFLISLSIMASAASTLFHSGVELVHASQMLLLLKPLAGPFAMAIFGVGIIAAGVSSQFPNVILLPLLLSDYRNEPPELKKNSVRWIVLAISLLGLVVPVFKAPPVLVMIASQAFGALLLPFTVLCMLYLGNRKKLMKEHVFKTGTNIIMILILCFAFIMTFNGFKGIVPLVEGLF